MYVIRYTYADGRESVSPYYLSSREVAEQSAERTVAERHNVTDARVEEL